MSKIWKLIQILFSLILNLIIFMAVGILAAWLFWSIPPQQSFKNIAYFFSQTHAIISGHPQKSEQN